MRGSSLLVIGALALGAMGSARGQTEYIAECVQRGVDAAGRAIEAAEGMTFGMNTNGYCLLGGWVKQGESLEYSMTLQANTCYVIIGAGDRDVADLDIALKQGDTVLEKDEQEDNIPGVVVQFDQQVEATLVVTNYKGSGQADFCSVIIMESDGGQANVTSLNQAAQGLCQIINKQAGFITDGQTTSGWCMFGALLQSGGEHGVTRRFEPGTYRLVGWGDSRAKDVDARVTNGDGETVAEDVLEDNQPVVDFEVTGKSPLEGSFFLKMHQAKGNSFAVCAVLKRS